jgi:hypothetical protein
MEFDTRQVFTNLKTAQGALDEWVTYWTRHVSQRLALRLRMKTSRAKPLPAA